MLQMKYVVGLTVVLAAGLLSANVAVCDEKPGQQPRATSERWDDDSRLLGQVAMVQGEDAGPPGPPRAIRDNSSPPPRRGQGQGAGRMQGLPADRNDGGPMRSMGPGGGGMGMPGGDGMGMPGGNGMGMGPGMNPNCPMGGDMLRNDPEMRELLQKDGQLERDSRQLAAQYQQAATEKREEIKKEVGELVSKQFNVRQQRRNLELKRLEDQLQRLREAVSRREKARKELVEKRVSELLGINQEVDF